MNKYIISSTRSGLSNRLKCLISSLHMSEKTNSELLLYWPKNHSCNCYFSDLFENNIKGISKREMINIVKNRKYEIILDKLDGFKGKKQFTLNVSTRFIGFTKKDIHLKFQEIPEEVLKEIIFYLKKLKIKKDILDEVKKFSNKNFGKNMVGIHIRKGDFKVIDNKVGSVSSEDKFIEEIKNLIKKNKKTKFLLATEDKVTEEKFKAIFKDKVISYSKQTKYREQEGAVKEALIELLLLSKCNLILGNFGSSFTELAWFLGECKPKINIIIEEKALEEHLRLEKKKKRFTNKFKELIYKIITPPSIRIVGKED
jgi:hypothetical protein